VASSIVLHCALHLSKNTARFITYNYFNYEANVTVFEVSEFSIPDEAHRHISMSVHSTPMTVCSRRPKYQPNAAGVSLLALITADEAFCFSP
jgi:hypothetical protein